MAFLSCPNVRIAGISAGVPANVVSNLSIGELSKEYDAGAFVELTGVKERRTGNFTASDLCIPAAERLISDLKWEKEEIDAVVFVSQHGDYIVPATACIIQDRLGLDTNCYALDISLGCSGFVYGLSVLGSIISAGGTVRKGLLMCGDAKRRVAVDDPLFGYAGTVTALEYKEGIDGLKFHFGTDGSGFDAIIIPDGGARNQITEKSLIPEEIDGKRYLPLQSRMKGMDVFSFGISTAPKSIKMLAEHFDFDYQTSDYFVFHQANMKMNNMIVKKLKLDESKVPSCMYHFGNTSSASIPLTIVTQLKGKIENRPTKFICCGFGVGLSWGSVAFETDKIILADLVECKNDKDV